MKRWTLAVILAAATLPAMAQPRADYRTQKNMSAGQCVALLSYQNRPDADVRAAFAAAPDVDVAGMYAQRWLDLTAEAAKERDPKAAMAMLVDLGTRACETIGVKG